MADLPDYIPLSWGYDDPDYEVVRGHVSADAMREALVAYYCGAEHVPGLSGEPRHVYGTLPLPTGSPVATTAPSRCGAALVEANHRIRTLIAKKEAP